VFDIISKRLEIETLASMAWQSRSTRERILDHAVGHSQAVCLRARVN
jgi:hypothetical protein